jgi:DNA invertase Pin-like site-specific DNA recombinase
MKAVGYVRVSTDKQAESGLSLEGQRQKVESYANLHDYDLLDVHEDAGESGKDLNRDGLRTALDALENGEADCLIVYKVNRLSRHVGDMQTLIEGYFGESADHNLAAVADHVDTTTATGRMMLNILLSVDQGERERIGERTREALQLKKQRGEYTGGKVPFGKQLADDGIHLEDNPAEQRALELIRELRNEGHTLADVADELNRRGVPRRNGNDWHAMAVSRAQKSAA